MFEDRYAQIQYDSDNLENVTVKEVRDVPEGKGSLEDVVSEKLRETAEFVQEIVNREKNDTIPGNTGGMAQDWPAGDRGGRFFGRLEPSGQNASFSQGEPSFQGSPARQGMPFWQDPALSQGGRFPQSPSYPQERNPYPENYVPQKPFSNQGGYVPQKTPSGHR